MLAMCYAAHGGPELVRAARLHVPRPGPREVLVALAAASVVPLDWKLRAGRLAAYFSPELPKVPGRDGAGRVLACGAEVSGFRPGDRVGVMVPPPVARGSYAGAVLAREEELVLLPLALPTLEAAALVNAGLSAWIAAVRCADVQPGQRVLVHGGAGAVGGVLVQLCAHLGAEVSATCRATNRDYVRGLGAARAVAYDAEDFTTLPAQDVVFDPIGGTVHDRSYEVLRPGGHLVWLTAAPIVERGAEYNVRVTRAPIRDERTPVAAVFDLAARGILRAQIAARMPLVQAGEAQRRLEFGQISRGRLVLEIGTALFGPGGVPFTGPWDDS